MDKNNDTAKPNRPDDDDAKENQAVGDVLGLGRITPSGNGRAADDDDENAHQHPSPDERDHVGSRDVTEGTSGGTGPDLGGSDVFRRRSGATGTDIGR